MKRDATDHYHARMQRVLAHIDEHLDEDAEEYEKRHREKDQARHALVDAVDHDGQRRMRREGEIGHGRDAEGEGDRHADGYAGGDDDDEDNSSLANPGAASSIEVFSLILIDADSREEGMSAGRF